MNRRLIVRPEAEADITDFRVHSAIARALRNPESLRAFAAIQQSVVFLLAGFPIACFSLFGRMQWSFLPCFMQCDTIEFGSIVQKVTSNVSDEHYELEPQM